MTRSRLIELRKACMAQISSLSTRLLTDEPMSQAELQRLTFLTAVHCATTHELRAMTDDVETASAIVHLDTALGILCELRFGKISGQEADDMLRPLLHSALAFLES